LLQLASKKQKAPSSPGFSATQVPVLVSQYQPWGHWLLSVQLFWTHWPVEVLQWLPSGQAVSLRHQQRPSGLHS